ncbi:MAG: hypothetical protein A2X66_08760 [Ignavibacteria bacterium GWA2_54_16]|nr:MAG: hypothetical protein A2X66_08760 [Ignavibacteria bacterium GWA2_54_16]
MRVSRRILVLLAPSIILAFVAQAQYFPKLGRAATYQKSLDVQSRLNVLSIALRPGYEDLAALAYFRLGRGAQIMSAFVTNAEAGESDLLGVYPHELAAERRREATDAIRLLDGGAFFLNLPDVAAARDTGFIRSIWQADTLMKRLSKLITDFRPDIILVSRDWLGGAGSPQIQVLEAELTRALRHVESIKRTDLLGVNPWTVARVLVDKGTKADVQTPTERIHPLWKKSYRQIGDEAGRAYRSIAVQKKRWMADAFGEKAQHATISYKLLFRRGAGLKRTDQGLPAPLPASLSDVGKGIADLAAAAMRGESKPSGAGNKPENTPLRLVAVMAQIDRLTTRLAELTPQERKIALQWKSTLEDLRIVLLGIEVRYTFGPNVLTERQVALLNIDTVIGVKPGGTTFLYFPEVGPQGWVVNEQVEKRVNIEFHKPYRILTPNNLAYHLPAALQGLERSSTAKVFLFYLIHQGAKPEENLIYRMAEPVQHAPRFTVEVLTPLVSVIPAERVAIRVTNHSRDGVRDSVYVDDSLATSAKREFRLNTKDEAQLDTLVLTWNKTLDEGTYNIPVKIDNNTMSSFAARRFDVRMDASKKVALITGIQGSPTATALRRLGANWTTLEPHPEAVTDVSKFDVVLIDRRAMTLASGVETYRGALEQFVEKGGHLIILAQDAGVWNFRPLVDGLKLTASGLYDDRTSIDTDTTSRILTTPNLIVRSEWSNWLFQIAYNALSGPALSQAATPVKSAADRNPLIAMWKKGRGTITYADLAFNPQTFNVHPGAYRLLANLLSY